MQRFACERCGLEDEAKNMLMEEVYFMNMGYWCKDCFTRHVEAKNEYLGQEGHWCCQDFKNSKNEYVHYNLPYIGDKPCKL